MVTTVTVIYPAGADATFNLEYYLSTHMPLVYDKWHPHGLTSWRVTKVAGAAGGGESPYTIQALLEFGSQDEVNKALAAEAPAILGDIPNFSNKDPIIFVGDVVGSHGV